MPKAVDHDLQRRSLLLQSFPFFAEHGFAGMSIRKLAQSLGFSTGILYHYFKSKEEIFEAMMQLVMTENADENLAFLADYSTISERMQALGRSFTKQQDVLRLQTILCAEYCRHLQEHQRSTEDFWELVKPQYRALAGHILGYQDPVGFELVSTFVQGILLRFSWGDEPIPMIELFQEFGTFLQARFERPDRKPNA